MSAELWVKKEAVSNVTGWSDRTIRWKVQRRVLLSRNASNRQNRSCGAREYALSSLPVEAQLKFLKQPLLSGPAYTALALRQDTNQSNLFATVLEITEPERLDFSPAQNGATARFVCDLFAFARTRNDPHPQPAVTYALSREMRVSR